MWVCWLIDLFFGEIAEKVMGNFCDVFVQEYAF